MKLACAAASAFALAACSSSAKAPGPVSNTSPTEAPAEAEPGMEDGALWTCQIEDYDPQPCKLSKTPDGWSLAKLMGSQRFRGVIEWTGPDTAHFVGEFFCPWGECTDHMDVTFTRDVAAFTADYGGGPISIRYDAALATEWGGAGYGRLTGDEL